GLRTSRAEDLSAAAVRAAILSHGCAYVPGLVAPERVELLVGDIDRVFDGHERHSSGTPGSKTLPWYEPFAPNSEYTLPPDRTWVSGAGGVWAVDSPRAMFDMVDAFEQ